MKYAICCLLFLTCATIVRSDDQHVAVLASKYSNDVYQFEMTPPNFGEARGTAVPAMFSAPVVDGFAANVNVMIQANQPDYDKYLAVTKQQIEEMQGEMIATKVMKIGDHHAFRTEYSMPGKTGNMHFLQLAVFVDSKVYLITASDRQSQFETHRREFEKCLDSFKLSL